MSDISQATSKTRHNEALKMFQSTSKVKHKGAVRYYENYLLQKQNKTNLRDSSNYLKTRHKKTPRFFQITSK